MFEKSLIRIKFLQDFHKMRVWAGYFFGISQAVLLSMNYVRFSADLEIQPAEPFLLLMNNWFSYTLMALGYFIVVADAPFIDNLSNAVILRSGSRQRWARGMGIYLLLQSFLYWGIMYAACFSVSAFGNLSVQNEWGRVLQTILRIRPEAALEYGFVFFSPEVLETWTPAAALLHSFLLAVCYTYTFSLLMFALNFLSRFPLGNFLVLMLHFLGVLFIKNEGLLPLGGSLLANAILEFHDGRNTGMSLTYSYLLFAVLLAAEGIGIKNLIRKCDFRVANSERLW